MPSIWLWVALIGFAAAFRYWMFDVRCWMFDVPSAPPPAPSQAGKGGAWRLHGFRRYRVAGPARFWGFPLPNGGNLAHPKVSIVGTCLFRPKGPSPRSLIWLRAKTNAKPQEPSNHAPSSYPNLRLS